MRSTGAQGYLKYLWLMLALAAGPVIADTARIYVTNSAGDNIHVIDPATNKVVQVDQWHRSVTRSDFLA